MILRVILFTMVAAVSGCMSTRYQNVSDMADVYPELRKSYVVGGVYELLEDFVLCDLGDRYLLIDEPKDQGIANLAEATKHPRCRGVVERGTALSILRLEYARRLPGITSGVDAIATLKTGEHKGVIVSLSFISGTEFNTRLNTIALPDPRKTRRVDSPTASSGLEE